jgi:capsular exopolysaccharide synthesis family protein
VVNAARVPTSPTSPKPLRNALIGLVVGLILVILLALLINHLDDGIKSRQDVYEASGHLPIVGMVPAVSGWRGSGDHLALEEDSSSPVSEAYRTLRTAVRFLTLDTDQSVLAVTSAKPQEGKSTAVANLAQSFARAGSRVVVVSCDLRRPSLHKFYHRSNAVGLSSALLGDTGLQNCIQTTEEPRLKLLSSGPAPPNPSEVLSSRRTHAILRSLGQQADVVLIYCPPVLPVTDALLISALVDGVLVVASARSTSKGDLRRAYELLNQVNAPVLGTILNRIPASTASTYGYEYGYYSYQSGAGPGPGATAERRDPSPPLIGRSATNGRNPTAHGNQDDSSTNGSGHRQAFPPAGSARP